MTEYQQLELNHSPPDPANGTTCETPRFRNWEYWDEFIFVDLDRGQSLSLGTFLSGLGYWRRFGSFPRALHHPALDAGKFVAYSAQDRFRPFARGYGLGVIGDLLGHVHQKYDETGHGKQKRGSSRKRRESNASQSQCAGRDPDPYRPFGEGGSRVKIFQLLLEAA